jgi:hypothetical protein
MLYLDNQAKIKHNKIKITIMLNVLGKHNNYLYIFYIFLYIYMSTSANSSSGIVSYTSDNERMVILAQPTVSTETTEVFNDRLENSTVRYLASGVSHAAITDTPPTNLTVTQLLRDEFDVETTSDISDISFALMSRYDESIEQTLDSYSYNIGTSEQSVQKKVGIELPSNSIYDSHIRFDYSVNSGPFFSTSNNNLSSGVSDMNGTIPNKGNWTATFDETSSNVNYSKAINSEYNTGGNKPLTVDEYVSFNKSYSLGMDLLSSDKIQDYFILDSSNGKPTPIPIPNTGVTSTLGTLNSESFRLADNGLFGVKSTTFSSIGPQHYGAYRIQQFPDSPIITVSNNNVISYSETDETTTLTNAPIFNANNSAPLPKNQLSTTVFNSMFNRTVEPATSGYKYTVSVTEKLNSGYSPNANMVGRTDSANTFTLDDTSLMNNSSYIKNYVGGVHTLSFTPSTLVIQSDSTEFAPNISLLSLNNIRETLTLNNINNGQIKINTRSPTTRHVTDSNSTLSITPNVFYNTEDVKGGISDTLRKNSSVSYLAQMVAKNTKDISNSFMKNSGNGNIALDLYNGIDISNTFFNANNFEFVASSPNTNNDAEVFKIKSKKQVADMFTFNKLTSNNYDDATLIESVYISAHVENLVSSRSADNIFQSARMLFNLNTLTNSSIYTDATSKGWNITLPSQYNGKMVSSVLNANASNTTYFPSLEETTNLININNGNSIKYSISVITNSNATQSIEIKWSSNDFVNSNTIIISESNITRTLSEPTLVSEKITTPITLSGPLVGKTIELNKVTSQRQQTYSFNLPLRPFTGLTMTTTSITMTSVYYTIKDVSNINNQFSYPSSFLKNISDSAKTNYSLITNTYSSIPPVTGSLNASNLCDMLVKIIGKDINNNDIDFTNETPVSAMYGLESKVILKSIAQETNIESCVFKVGITTEYKLDSGEVNNLLFDSVNFGYTVSLNNNYDTTYTVDYWSANVSNITSKTNIETTSDTTDYSNKSLTVANGYSSIDTWNNTEYSIVVSYEQPNNATTVLNIRKTGTITNMYQIKIKNSNKLNTQLFISNISKDIYRFNSWIGKNATNSNITFSEKFSTVDYKFTNGATNYSNLIAIDSGVFLTNSILNSTTFNQISDIGKYIKFSLSGDLIGINMVNNVTELNEIVHVSGINTTTIENHTISNSGLSFQYTNGAEGSRILSIDRYRGFNSPTNNQSSIDQVYTLQRTKSVATLSISRSVTDATIPSTISKSFDVSINNSITIDNLSGTVGTNNVVIGNIGLKITCLLSMFTSTDTRSFTIYKMGDDVSFSILKPSANKKVPPATTLQSFVLDTFSGSNFNNTTKALSINSYRLKIKTSNSSNPFNNTSTSWSVGLNDKKVNIYRNNSYLGNPQNLDNNDAFFEPDSTKWVNIAPTANYTFANLVTGISIGPWIIRTQNTAATYVYRPSISMFVIIPPYLYFSQVSSKTKTLPYVFSETDLQESYLPVSNTVNGTQTYNPFANSTKYSYIATTNNSDDVTVSFDQKMVNNITFVQTKPEVLSNYSSRTTVATQYFVVEGTNVRISIAVGLKDQVSTLSIATLFGGNNGLPSNRLMFSTSPTSPYLNMDELINNKSGILMKLFQPLITNTPFNNLTVRDVFSNSATDNFNIKIMVENFFILPSISLTNPKINSFSLDLPTGKGTKVTLYTRQTLSSNDGSIQIYVYKYESLNPVDYNNVNANGTIDKLSQAIKLQFLNRKYKMVSISSSEYANAFTQLSLSGLPTGTRLNQSYDAFIASQAPKFDSLPWIQDTSFENDDIQKDLLYVSIECYTQRSQQRILPMLFSTRPDGKAKSVMIFKYPISTTLDKLGRKIFQITNWGSTISNSLVTSNLYTVIPKGVPTTGDFSNVLKNSLSGWSLNPILPPY